MDAYRSASLGAIQNHFMLHVYLHRLSIAKNRVLCHVTRSVCLMRVGPPSKRALSRAQRVFFAFAAFLSASHATQDLRNFRVNEKKEHPYVLQVYKL